MKMENFCLILSHRYVIRNGIFDDVRYDSISTLWCCSVGL